jgi:hypothetical protein
MKKIRSAKDAAGETIRRGDVVRVIGVPDLKGMSAAGLRESRPIFKHVLGTYRKIHGFDPYGFAEIFLKIRKGLHSGWHGIVIEPHLLKRKRTQPNVSVQPIARKTRSG